MYSLWAYNVCIYALLVWIILIIKDFRVCLTYVTRVYKVRLLFTFSFNIVANFLFLFSLTKNPQNALPPQLLLIVIRNNEIGRKRKKEFYATSRKIIQNREREKEERNGFDAEGKKKKKKILFPSVTVFSNCGLHHRSKSSRTKYPSLHF